MTENRFEIGIIGGGPAGSSAALLLSKSGFNVCLFEKNQFPRETVCGEFLSHEVFEFLEENNHEEKFLSLNPNPINSFKIIFSNNISVQCNLSFTGYGLKRSTFDSFLLNEAINSGTKVFQPANVVDLIKKENNYIVKFSKDNNNCSVTCNNIIAAYGKQNIFDKKLNRNFTEIKSKLNGIKFHFEINELPGFAKNEIQIYSTDSMYCGVNAVNDNKVTVCFLENRNNYNYASRKHLKDLINKNTSFSKLLSAGFSDLVDSSELYGTGNIYFGKKEIIKDGIFMAGDAARIIAPLAGDGISMALQNSKLISNTLELKRRNKLSDVSTELLYKQLWQKEFQKRIFTALYIQKILFNKYLHKAGSNLIHLYPGLLKYLIKQTRG